MKARISLDSALLDEKIDRLKELFPESIPDNLHCDLLSLADDLILIDGGTTFAADGVFEIVQRIDFGRRYDDLFAALRANNTN